MATKLIPFLVKYKTKKIKPGERIIRARNAADAIARLKNDVEGLVKIEEPRLATQRELETRRRKKDIETMTQTKPKYDRTIGKPMTAKRARQKSDVTTSPQTSSPTISDSKKHNKNLLECFDLEGIIEDLKVILANALEEE